MLVVPIARCHATSAWHLEELALVGQLVIAVFTAVPLSGRREGEGAWWREDQAPLPCLRRSPFPGCRLMLHLLHEPPQLAKYCESRLPVEPGRRSGRQHRYRAPELLNFPRGEVVHVRAS